MEVIQARVNERLLSKADRLFTGTLDGRIIEILQNARRAGATEVHIINSDGRVTVRDNGQGISAEDQGRLFIPFTRVGQADAKGQGLGLSIVRDIVEKLGGQVGLESTIGQGSLFTFTLPAAESSTYSSLKRLVISSLEKTPTGNKSLISVSATTNSLSPFLTLDSSKCSSTKPSWLVSTSLSSTKATLPKPRSWILNRSRNERRTLANASNAACSAPVMVA